MEQRHEHPLPPSRLRHQQHQQYQQHQPRRKHPPPRKDHVSNRMIGHRMSMPVR